MLTGRFLTARDETAEPPLRQVRYVRRAVNLREKPTTKSRVLVVLRPPNEVTLSVKPEGGWWVVFAQWRRGYVADLPGLFGERADPLRCAIALNSPAIVVRSDASESGRPVAQAMPGAQFYCGPVSDDGAWVRITNRKQQWGWIPRRDASLGVPIE
jgi:hypothetical protein